MAASVNGNIPLNYEKAISSSDVEKWQIARQNELNSHLENKTWILVPLHPGKPLTKGEWDFDIKRESGGSIERYKAR